VVLSLLKLLRPKQWMKNVLVFAAPVSAGEGTEPQIMLLALGGFVCFSIVASGLYAVNDVQDAERDRLHPRKRNRPIASGAVSPRTGVTIGVLMMASGLGFGLLISVSMVFIPLIYC
jgi:decaprenyl-phosphate phosphoribosyltransferase